MAHTRTHTRTHSHTPPTTNAQPNRYRSHLTSPHLTSLLCSTSFAMLYWHPHAISLFLSRMVSYASLGTPADAHLNGNFEFPISTLLSLTPSPRPPPFTVHNTATLPHTYTTHMYMYSYKHSSTADINHDQNHRLTKIRILF